MKKSLSLLALLPLMATAQNNLPPASQADSAWLFSYATSKDHNHGGLHFAWSLDRQEWHEIGPEWNFVKSDYGTWGAEKRMLHPRMTRNNEGVWEVVWEVNERDNVLAYTCTSDLIHWKPQDYYKKGEGPVAHLFPAQTGTFKEVMLPSAGRVHGEVHRVSWPEVNALIQECQRGRYEASLNAERAIDDLNGRFRNLKPQQTLITVSRGEGKPISDKLIGIFFEDINYAADGGLYAELVQNRDFEYNEADHGGWHSLTAWESESLQASIGAATPIHPNNAHYVILDVPEGASRPSFSNTGYDGIVVRKGQKYDFSLFGRLVEGKNGRVNVALTQPDGTTVAQGSVTLPKGSSWKQVNVVLTATADADAARLTLLPQAAGSYHLDMVSLFPKDTYKGRKNGMRRDLAEALEALHPQFVRFPGGCVAHGQGLDNIYRWKNTVGPLEARKPDFNIWGYHQSFGLGYYEYFQLCEDLGARPLPVLAAGVPCQNSHRGGAGQQGGIPMDQMADYIQDVLDLIEWANGDPKASNWAKMRAEAGHPKPFGLQMIGIGNEDLISEVFEERFRMIYEAVTSRYPEIEVVGTVGPFWEGSDYEEGWRLARELEIPYVDEHYYNSPGWFINHQDFYDRYQRPSVDGGGNRKNLTQVYLGEYASHINGRANCLETALSEALYLCNVERNADVVSMTSYAPLFSKKGHTQWTPDMIYFDNAEVRLSSGYQVQLMFGQNAGTTYLPALTRVCDQGADIEKSFAGADVSKRIASSTVIDPKTQEYIVKVVNYLPVANSVTIELPVDAVAAVTGELLTGQLGDTSAAPVPLEGVSIDGNKVQLQLPAYSFAVLRCGK